VSTVRLSHTSYVVLGLVDQLGAATPYDLKRAAAAGVGHFWSLPHTQLYSEPERLAAAGYLDEERERTGRRRRRYSLTHSGRRALAQWLGASDDELYEIRDPGLLRLFFGADPRKLAATQLEAHRQNLGYLESLRGDAEGVPEGVRLAVEAGIGHAREYVRFWTRVSNPEDA
jgi:PadR family transcriptional regulator AphA